MLTKRSFFMAGKATATVVSKKTGTRFTFRVESLDRKDVNAPRFVKVLTGSDNETNYSFFGTIFANGIFKKSSKAKVSLDAPSVRAFEWMWSNIEKDLTELMEFMPACNCARCGRTLTVPTSIENALGPECAGKLGL